MMLPYKVPGLPRPEKSTMDNIRWFGVNDAGADPASDGREMAFVMLRNDLL